MPLVQAPQAGGTSSARQTLRLLLCLLIYRGAGVAGMVRFAPANENQGTQSILSDGKSQTRNGAHVSTPQKGGYTVKNGFSWMGTVPIHENPVFTV